MQILGYGATNSDARSESTGRAPPLQGHVGAVWTQAPGHTESAAKGPMTCYWKHPVSAWGGSGWEAPPTHCCP